MSVVGRPRQSWTKGWKRKKGIEAARDEIESVNAARCKKEEGLREGSLTTRRKEGFQTVELDCSKKWTEQRQ